MNGNLLVCFRQQPGRREGINLSMRRARTWNLEQGMDKLTLQRKRKEDEDKYLQRKQGSTAGRALWRMADAKVVGLAPLSGYHLDSQAAR